MERVYWRTLPGTGKPFFPPNLEGTWAKLEGYAARLALVIHEIRFALGEAGEDVDAVSMTGAIKLIDYFKSHARKVYAKLKFSAEDKKVLGAVDWIEKQGGKVTVRDICRSGVCNIKKTSEAKALFRELQDRGHGKIVSGEREGEVFEIKNLPDNTT